MASLGTIGELLAQAIKNAFYELLSKRHLYQSVEVSLTLMNDHVEAEAEKAFEEMASALSSPGVRAYGSPEHARKSTLIAGKNTIEKASGTIWEVRPSDTIFGTPERPLMDHVVYFDLPTIHTICPVCEREWPFNPIRLTHPDKIIDSERIAHDIPNGVQVFACAYQCQSCKSEPLIFLIRRRGTKLTLAGRSIMEMVVAPAFLPKHLRKHYSDAIIAFNAGQILPALFMLRVVIEQFWRELQKRGVLIVEKSSARLPVDRLGAAYNAALPADFKEHFPSLPKLYEEISRRLHNADADADMFQSAHHDLIQHFDARRLRKLDSEDAKRVGPNTVRQKRVK